MPNHSPEPWTMSNYGCLTSIYDAAGKTLQQAYEGELLEADAARIVACVNFCQGIPSDDLNHGLGVFAQAYLDSRQRILTPKVAKAILALKEGGG